MHEIAQRLAPASRVMYVENDPVVLAHARALLNSSETGATQYIDADLRDTDTIVRQAGELLDFTRPVAVTLLAILHAIPDSDDPHMLVARLLDSLPSGSYLAISHAGSDLMGDALDSLEDIVTQMVEIQPGFRTREGVGRFFAGMDLVEPGLVRVEEWRPGPAADGAGTSKIWCAVGRKP